MHCILHSNTTHTRMRALWKGKTLAESNDTIVVENNHYFPLSSINKDYFKHSDHTTLCPWKGQAHYYHIEVDGETNQNAAWYYPKPKEAAGEIINRIAFWKGVKVEK